jgi:hypothetical protein
MVFSSDKKTNVIFTAGVLLLTIFCLWQGFAFVYWAMSGMHQAEGDRQQRARDRDAADRQERIDQAAERLKEGREAVDKAFPELKNP